jgi:hypothetical protein
MSGREQPSVFTSSPGSLCRVVVNLCDNRVQGGFESVGAALGLGKEKSALHSGEQCKGKPARG